MTPAGIARLKLDEGLRCYPYDDKSGMAIKLGPAGGKVTIGYGRNLTDQPLTEQEAGIWLADNLARDWAYLVRYEPWLWTAPPVWQDVVSMVEYNTGQALNFPHMLAAMQAGDGATAAMELLDSAAARELPERYQRMARAIESGAWV